MWQMNAFVIVSLLVGLVPCTNTNSCNAFFKVKSVCGTNYGIPLKTYTVDQSKAKCALACSQDDSCLSSVFDSLTGICQTFPEYKSVGACDTQEFYSAAFQSSCHVPPVISGEMFSMCELSSDCHIPDSECRTGKCQCLPGLSYDPSSKTCVTNCTSYGKTFQEDLGHLLVGLTNAAESFIDTQTCLLACISQTTFICRTVEIWKDGSMCYFSKDTANTTSPSARQENPGYNLYQRDCALI